MLAGASLPTLQHEPPRIAARPLISMPRYFEEAREEDEAEPAVTTSGSELPSVPVQAPAPVSGSRSAATLRQMLDSVNEGSAPVRTAPLADGLGRFPGFRDATKRTPIFQESHESAARVPGAYVPPAISELRQELVPVPASVFDDDFFKKPNDELRAAAPESGTQWPEVKVPSFAGYAAEETNKGEDLDIPAFMRRNP
jgi:cell division protein FtsZ